MIDIFISIVNMSITASIVALMVMLLRIPLKKAPRIFSYALWGVVMFRLIFPISFTSIFSLMPTPTNILPQDFVSTLNPVTQIADTSVNMVTDSTMPIVTHIVETSPSISVTYVASFVWIFGFIILLIFALVGYVSLKRRVRFATLICDNIYETDYIKTPFVLGFILPKIYFPTTIDPSRHDYILKHEQIHIKRRDYLIKPFAYIVFALHWFNPLMWIAYFLMSKDMEMSCDEAVLKKTDKDIRKEYSTSLLSLSVKRVSLLSPTAFSIGEGNVMERITNVLRFKKSANWVVVLSVVVVSLFLIGFSSDRILAIDAPSGSHGNVYMNSLRFDIDNWSIDDNGARVASHEQAHEIGLQILNTYFSAYRHDWGRFGSDSFSLISHPAFYDENGNTHVQPWAGRVFANELTIIEDDVWGNSYFYAPIFLFDIDTETGQLTSTVYVTPPEYISTDIVPFTFSFEEAVEIYGNALQEVSSHKNSEYVDMLLDFSLEFVGRAGYHDSEVVDIDLINSWSNFYENHVGTVVTVSFTSGKEAHIYFRVFETQFTIEGLRLDF